MGQGIVRSLERSFLPHLGRCSRKKIGINSGRGVKTSKNMKNIIKTAATLITITLLTFNTATLSAQDPPPPPPDHGTGGNVPGGGAPIAGGIGILLVLGAAYGGKKVWDMRKE